MSTASAVVSTLWPMASETEDMEIRIRRNLVRFRKELGLSQEQAAARAGISVDNWRRYERERTPDAVTLGVIAMALGHTTDHFYLEAPPASDPAIVAPFMLKVAHGVVVDDDLQAKVRTFLAGVNREHQERLRQKKGVRKK